jgi:hypothetical protein
MKLALDVKLTPKQLAEAFCEMNDEDQAQFFIECAAIAATWKVDPREMSGGPGMQWWSAGRHLATCDCSTHEAREMVRDIADGAERAA